MSLPLIINSEADGYSNRAAEILSSVARIQNGPSERGALKKALREAQGLIVRLGNRVDQDLLDGALSLRFVASATTGTNHLDLQYLARRRIRVICLKGEAGFLSTVTATAEHTWGLLLALIRNLPIASESVNSGKWDRDLFIGRELSGMTIGVIGYGRLGKIVAEYAKAFRMRVLVNDVSSVDIEDGIDLVGLEQLLAESDIVSLHAPLNSSTENFFGVTQFEKMKRGAYLINTARGELIDEVQLIAALESGILAGAAVDVVCDETRWHKQIPITNKMFAYAKENNNLIITPHIGGATIDSMLKTECFIANKIARFLGET